jgi:hypothetical protein
MSLDHIDIRILWKSVGFEPGKLPQAIPENWISSSSRDTTYWLSVG